MARPASPHPTEAETQILAVLWEHGPSTVRQIHNALRPLKDTNYSTTVKMLAVMMDKNLVRRDESARPHVYRAGVSRRRAQQRMLHGLIHKLYDGSTKSLVMQALSTQKATPQELDEIRQLLDQLQGDDR